MKGIHYGAYWMGYNDVVQLMSQELCKVCEVVRINTSLYDKNQNLRKRFIEEVSLPNGKVIYWLREDRVLADVAEHCPDFIIVNSGGIGLRRTTSQLLRKRKIVTIGISLSDPDVYNDHGRRYAAHFDLFLTNSQYSLEHQYKVNRQQVVLLPFAAAEKYHRPMTRIKKTCDIGIIGHYRKDRSSLVRLLEKHYHVGLWGKGWRGRGGPVYHLEHVMALNSCRLYLSFARTMANYLNVKVGIFEAIASGVPVVVYPYCGEVNNYFQYGTEIIAGFGESQLVRAIQIYMEDDIKRKWIAENAYHRLTKEHTWKHRWDKVLGRINEIHEQF